MATAYKQVLEACKGTSRRAPPGCLDSIISETKKELGLSINTTINKYTIKSRMGKSAKSITPKHPGTVSPLDAIEPILVAAVMQMAKINLPMDKHDLLSYANSMIEGTEHQDRLVKYKEKVKVAQSDEKMGIAGLAFYSGFLKRFSHLEKWSKEELKTFLQYKKRKTGDPAMPTGLPDLQQRAREWQERPSPNPSPCNSDAEDDGEETPADVFIDSSSMVI